MKKTFLTLLITLTLAFAGCVGVFSPVHSTRAEETQASLILWERNYQLVPSTVTYYASSFDRADLFFAKAYHGGQLGYVLVNKAVDPIAILWSDTGDFDIVSPPTPIL